MGNYFSETHEPTYNKSLLDQLRERNMSDLMECLNCVNEDYPDSNCITYSQFEDIFAPMVNDPEPFFLVLQNEHNLDGVVDVYETLAAFAIFLQDRFENKATFIFKLFDFDKSNSIEMSELIMTLQSAARGLCKLVNLPPPTLESLELEAKKLFDLIDLDKNHRITFDEFTIWINDNAKLQEFLLKYANIQTFHNLRNRFDKIFLRFLSIFLGTAAKSVKPDHVEESVLFSLIKYEAGSGVTDQDLNFLFYVLKNTTVAFSKGEVVERDGLISREAYESVMKAWCAFSASDFNNDNSLAPYEMHALLWLFDEKEPSEFKVQYEIDELTRNGKSKITRFDWIKSLCYIDSDEKEILDPLMKKLFSKYDKDNSGFLSLEELKEVIKESLKAYMVVSVNPEKKASVEAIVDGLTSEIFNELDTNNNKQVSWEEFKAYIKISPPKFKKLKNFLNMNNF